MKQKTLPRFMDTRSGARPSPAPVTGTEDGWSPEATFTLIDAWGKLHIELNRRSFRQIHWKQVAKSVNSLHSYGRKASRTYVQCKNRIDSLKKKYTIEKTRVSESDDFVTDWPFFERIDAFIGDNFPTKKPAPAPPVEPPVKVPSWTLAPVGLRSGAQKRQALETTTTSVESLEDDLQESRFRRNLSAFAAAAAAAAEEEIDNTESESGSDSDGFELSTESKKRKFGRKDMETGYREVANAIEKFSEIHERVEASKQRKKDSQRMQSSNDSRRMLSAKNSQRMQSSNDSHRMQFSNDSQRMQFSKGSQRMQSANDLLRIQSAKDSRRMQSSNDSQRMQSAKDFQRMQSSNDSQRMHSSNDFQRMQSSNDFKRMQSANDSQRIQSAKDSQRMQSANDFQRMQSSNDSQRLQSAKDSQRMQSTQESQRMQLHKTKRSKHMDDPSAHSQSGLDTESTKKNVRGATQAKKLLELYRINGQKLSIEFDQSTGKPLGKNKTNFKTYVGFIGRSKISILTEDWDSVDENVKSQIWKDILEVWDIPNTEFLRKNWVSYAGERWRAFKTNLSSRYIHGDLRDKSPLEVYDFLDEETWEAFVQMRQDPSFLEKRKKAQMSAAQNKFPHRLSRGGYELLQQKMMQEKLKQNKESMGDSVAAPPSPPARHEQWLRARQKPSGDYTSEDTRIVAEKIDSLIEQTSQGTFVPHGRRDILTVAIGQPEHSGRVRGVGRGVGIRQYFGPLPRHECIPPVLSSKQIETIKVELTQQIKEQLMQDLASMGFSKKYPNLPTCSPNNIVPTSTKNSYSVESPIPEEDEIPELCELYVDNFLHAVAYGNVYKLGPTIHNKMLDNDTVRVVVNEVLDANAQVPMPTDEVETVGQALNNFIQWPKRLVQIVSDKDGDGTGKDGDETGKDGDEIGIDDVAPKRSEPQLDSVQQLVLKAMSMSESIKLKLGHSGTEYFWLSQRDIMELCMGKQELSITILRLWLTYLNRLCINVGKSDLYGFIDPCFIQSQHDPTNAQAYIQKKLYEDKKECYLAPYYNNRHWQLLIICPRKNNVVFLCSLERKPDKIISHIVDSALDEYHKLQGVQRQKPIWIVPICQRQSECYECGYYIMIHMLNIVSAGIVDSWMQSFGDPEPFHENELINVRQRCASLILDFIQAVENV